MASGQYTPGGGVCSDNITWVLTDSLLWSWTSGSCIHSRCDALGCAVCSVQAGRVGLSPGGAVVRLSGIVALCFLGLRAWKFPGPAVEVLRDEVSTLRELQLSSLRVSQELSLTWGLEIIFHCRSTGLGLRPQLL